MPGNPDKAQRSEGRPPTGGTVRNEGEQVTQLCAHTQSGQHGAVPTVTTLHGYQCRATCERARRTACHEAQRTRRSADQGRRRQRHDGCGRVGRCNRRRSAAHGSRPGGHACEQRETVPGRWRAAVRDTAETTHLVDCGHSSSAGQPGPARDGAQSKDQEETPRRRGKRDTQVRKSVRDCVYFKVSLLTPCPC